MPQNYQALCGELLRALTGARSEFRVSNVRPQSELAQAQTVRERLLAMLALFFAGVALLLAGVGLYGVLDYSVLQRRREIGIRMAIGAQPGGIARLVTVEIFSMVLAGAVVGLALGMASVRYIATLFYQVKPTDTGMLVLPALAILAAALLAALPAVIHAVRIDPVKMLRAEWAYLDLVESRKTVGLPDRRNRGLHLAGRQRKPRPAEIELSRLPSAIRSGAYDFVAGPAKWDRISSCKPVSNRLLPPQNRNRRPPQPVVNRLAGWKPAPPLAMLKADGLRAAHCGTARFRSGHRRL